MKQKIYGATQEVLLRNGKKVRPVMLNNAATTPPFEATVSAVNDFLRTYSAYHRGSGPNSEVTCDRVDLAIQSIHKFVNAGDRVIIFTSNTSMAINYLVRLLRLGEYDFVTKSAQEHTSNNLPWKMAGREHSRIDFSVSDNGLIDYPGLGLTLGAYQGHGKCVLSLSGASNLTGYVPDIEAVSHLFHAAINPEEALLFVDAAQLAPHRPIDMDKMGIDALALSGHKLYAPYGLGVLIVPRWVAELVPTDPGGGSVDMISGNWEDIVWAPAESRHQIGSYNSVGIVALATSCRVYEEVGWEALVEHEKQLVYRFAQRMLNAGPDYIWYVPPHLYLGKQAEGDRLGVFPFNLRGYHHAKLAAILQYEFGIETRAGTICNHQLVRRWMRIDNQAQQEIVKKIALGDRLASYGVVRASLGVQNTTDDVDALFDALDYIIRRGPQLTYRPVPEKETFIPEK